MARVEIRELAAIFAGGAAGAVLRVWLGTTLATGGGWPWLTFDINLSGCAALAFFATRLQERLPQSTYRRPFLGTGLCGAYTTFSTMQVEIVKMLEQGHAGEAVAYGAASVAAGVTATWIVTAAVRRSRTLV